MNVSLCWGGWSPFSGASPPPDAPVCVGFRLRTGPGMSPYDVPVFRSDKHTAHIRYYFTHWSEQVVEETRLKRSISSSSVPTVSLRGQVTRRSHSSIGTKSLKKKLRLVVTFPVNSYDRTILYQRDVSHCRFVRNIMYYLYCILNLYMLNRSFVPPSSATPPLSHTDRTSSLVTFDSVLNEGHMRGGSVPHLDRIQDSPSGVLSVPKRSNSSVTYSTLSRVHNMSTPVNSIPADSLDRGTDFIMTSSDKM